MNAKPATSRHGPPQSTPKPQDPRRPYHVGVAVGVSAGLYAISLAGVTSLQVSVDRELIAERQPVLDAIAGLERHHDSLEARLEAARAAYGATTGEYGSLATGIADLHNRLAALGRDIAGIEGSGVARLSLPSIPHLGVAPAPAPAPRAKPPKTDAKTKASG